MSQMSSINVTEPASGKAGIYRHTRYGSRLVTLE
jgi:hypothetical protein